jgi:hypothetical protein
MGNCDPYSDSPEPAVVDKPQSTRVEEPTLLCNHLPLAGIPHGRFRRYQALDVLGEAKLGSECDLHSSRRPTKAWQKLILARIHELIEIA